MYKTLVGVFFLSPLLAYSQLASNSDENKVFVKIEVEAGFPGGTAKWREFVNRNFNFTRIEKNLPDSITSFSDTAKIQFIVDKNGIIKDIRFETTNSPSFKESCIEVFKK